MVVFYLHANDNIYDNRSNSLLFLDCISAAPLQTFSLEHLHTAFLGKEAAQVEAVFPNIMYVLSVKAASMCSVALSAWQEGG